MDPPPSLLFPLALDSGSDQKKEEEKKETNIAEGTSYIPGLRQAKACVPRNAHVQGKRTSRLNLHGIQDINPLLFLFCAHMGCSWEYSYASPPLLTSSNNLYQIIAALIPIFCTYTQMSTRLNQYPSSHPQTDLSTSLRRISFEGGQETMFVESLLDETRPAAFSLLTTPPHESLQGTVDKVSKKKRRLG